MGKTPVIPVEGDSNTNRGQEAGTSPQQVASPSKNVAHVLLSATIVAPEDLSAQDVVEPSVPSSSSAAPEETGDR